MLTTHTISRYVASISELGLTWCIYINSNSNQSNCFNTLQDTLNHILVENRRKMDKNLKNQHKLYINKIVNNIGTNKTFQ